MKTKLVSTLLLSIALSPIPLRADEAKPSDPPKAEEPKKEEPKKEEPKKEEPKKEEPKKEEPKKEEPKKEEPKKEEPKKEEPKKEEPKKEEPKKEESKKEEPKKEEPKKEEPKKEEPKPNEPEPNEKWSRETPEILKSWEPVLEEARKATVKIVREGKDVALGCAVHENGFIITKATEVHDKKNVFLTNLEVVFPEGLRLPVKLVDIHRPYDLALLKVEARGLRTMKWEESGPLPIGTFLAAATPLRLPAAVGVLSVLPRSLDEAQKGYLGVGLDKDKDGIIKVTSVSSQSPASRAGLVIDDIIKTIDGKTVDTVEECIRTIGSCRPYQKLKIVVGREKGDRELEVTLASRATNVPQGGEDPRNMMAGPLSRTRTGFPDVLQHDMVLQPQEIGGPVVDLDGHVVGMNIARSGRIECKAIPSRTLVTLLAKVGEGRFNHPELEAMREERKSAEEALNRLKKDLETLNGRIKEAESPDRKAEEEEKEKEKEKQKEKENS